MHGFSTRTQVGDLSGRGVGLDVVRSAVDALGGSVTLKSTVSKGTRMELMVPVAIGKERTLIVTCGHLLFGIPSRNVLEVIARSTIEVQTVAGGSVVRVPVTCRAAFAISQWQLDRRIGR